MYVLVAIDLVIGADIPSSSAVKLVSKSPQPIFLTMQVFI